MTEIRECLDTGASFAGRTFGIHSMAESLVSFLSSLSDSVVPSALFAQAIDSSSSFASARAFVQRSLDAANYNTFYYITSFLREMLTFSSSNGLSAEKLASLFSMILLRSPFPSSKNAEAITRKATEFIKLFLVDEK